MTAAQRLRLVLALCLVNIVLASVALSVGFVGLQTPPTTAGGPTPGIAFVSPLPTTPTGPEPTPAPSPEPGTSTPGTPTPTSAPGAEPTPSSPTGSPAVEPTPTVEPSPPVEPTPTVGPAQPAEPAATLTPVRVPPVVAQPNAPAPTPSPVRATPEPAETPVACPGKKADKVVHKGSKAGACRALKPDKVHKTHKPKHQHDKAKAPGKHKAEHHRTRHDGHEATVDKAQRGQKSGRRLRIVRRSR